MSYRKYLMTDDVPPSELYKTVKIDTDSDMISRQAAISAICNACGKIDCDEMDKCEKLQLPPANNSEIPNSSDTISRAKAIEVVDGYMKRLCGYIGTPNDTESYSYARGVLVGVTNNIKQLPSAQPERDTPKRVMWTGWKGHRYTRYNCPNCKKPVRNDDVYCHRCGQRLMFPKVSHTPYIEGQKQEVIVIWEDEVTE